VDFHKQDLGFRDDFFSVIVLLAVFEHIDRKRLKILMKNVQKVLKKDGQLIITTPSPWSAFVLWLFSRTFLISREEIDDHKPLISQKEILSVLSEAGFKKIKKGYFEFGFNMWFVAEK
jgi:predicted SAM-dependent methyltransferase